jgi:hypothetical protein
MPPTAPTNLQAFASGTNLMSVFLKWSGDPTTATEFRIERARPGTLFIEVGNVPASETSFEDSSGGFISGRKYWWRVRAYDANANQFSGYSNLAWRYMPVPMGFSPGQQFP